MWLFEATQRFSFSAARSSGIPSMGRSSPVKAFMIRARIPSVNPGQGAPERLFDRSREGGGTLADTKGHCLFQR
jgi:hypothetical protein